MKELKITPIKNGTVIDHIEPGMAMKVAKLLGIPDPDTHSTVSIAMFVKSTKMGYKDILKIEDRELKKREVNIISNPNCITNKEEPLEAEFTVTDGKEVKLRCIYCDRYVSDILESIV